MNAQPKHLEIFEAIQKQVQQIGLDAEPMTPPEAKLANAILVMLSVLIDMHPSKD